MSSLHSLHLSLYLISVLHLHYCVAQLIKPTGECTRVWHDWDGPLPHEDNEADQIEVPNYNCTLSEEQYRVLQDRISPLAVSSNYGIDLYTETLELVEDVLSS